MNVLVFCKIVILYIHVNILRFSETAVVSTYMFVYINIIMCQIKHNIKTKLSKRKIETKGFAFILL